MGVARTTGRVAAPPRPHAGAVTSTTSRTPRVPAPRRPRRTATADGRTPWGAVVALGVGIFALVTAEFLPASLLPRLAADLGITEGVAGQAVTATALMGIVAAPTVGLLFPRMDRRTLLAGLLGLAIVSDVLVATAPAFWVVLLSRLLLGISLAGFWGLAPSVTAKLAAPQHLGRAMMVANAGMPLATVTAVPVGTFLGETWGWRPVFWLAVGVTAVALVLLLLLVPRSAPTGSPSLRSLGETLRSRVLLLGLGGIVLVAGGHFTAFTYIRPAVERVPGITPGQIALLLSVLGVASVFGNLAAGAAADRHLRAALLTSPLLIGLGVASVGLFSGEFVAVVVATGVWGLAFGSLPTLVQTWLARTAPDRVEQGAGLVTAMFQVAIAVGAASGGLITDSAGVGTTYVVGAVAAIAGGALLRAASTSRH